MLTKMECGEVKDFESLSLSEIKSSDAQHKTINSNQTKPISKFRIFKNLAVVSVGTMIIVGTDDVLFTLQSTLNSEEGMGVLCLALQCFISSMTSLLMPKYLIYKIGSKTVLILSIIAFIPFFAANYNPTWLTMIASSPSIGVGFSLLWNSVCTYLNNLSGLFNDHCTDKEKKDMAETQTEYDLPRNQDDDLDDNYKELNNYSKDMHIRSNNISNNIKQTSKNHNWFKTKYKVTKYIFHSESDNKGNGKVSQIDSITSRVFGFHSLIYQTCYLWNNLMAYCILQTDSDPKYNTSISSNCSCGADYCNIDTDCSEANLRQPSEITRNILISMCIALSLGAALIIFLFLENFGTKETNVSFSLDFMLATLKQTRKKDLVLLIPLTIYPGLLRGFYVSDFAKSYIGCAWGIRYIGLVTACSGVTMAISSTLSGWFVKHIGRLKIFLIAAAVNSILMGILLIWQPDQNEKYMFFFCSGLYGALYGTFFTQLRAYFGVLFKEDEEAAFGAFNLWDQFGTAMSLAFSIYLCNYIKVYLLILCSTIGIMGYILVEKSHSCRNKELPMSSK